MKKFLSIVAVMAIVFALAIPAFAAAEAPTSSVGVTAPAVVSDPVMVGDEEAFVEAEVKTDVPAETKVALEEAVDAIADTLGEDVSVGPILEVELKTADGKPVSADYFDENEKLNVVFAYDKAGDVVGVLYWNDTTKAWDAVDEADLVVDPVKGTVSVAFKHLCRVVFVTKDSVVPPPVVEDPKPGTNGEHKSPGTGYNNTAAWVAAAMALVLGASFCFVSARKKVTE